MADSSCRRIRQRRWPAKLRKVSWSRPTAIWKALSQRCLRYQVDGDQLQLLDQSRGHPPALTCGRDAEIFDPALAAQRWGLIETNGQPAVPDSLVMFAFSEGYITGTNSCNGITGTMPLAVDGTLKIDFAGFARDARGCLSPEIPAQAERVEAILEDATSYAINGDVLTISDTAGNEVTFGPAADVLLIGETWNVPMLYTELPGGVNSGGRTRRRHRDHAHVQRGRHTRRQRQLQHLRWHLHTRRRIDSDRFPHIDEDGMPRPTRHHGAGNDLPRHAAGRHNLGHRAKRPDADNRRRACAAGTERGHP